MKRILFILVLLCVVTGTQAQFRVEKNIAYRTAGSNYALDRCKMDIYCPSTIPSGPLTTIVWFHGGGLAGGEKELPQQLQGKDLIIVGVNYRLISGRTDSQNMFPGVAVGEIIDDAACAVAWVFENITRYGGDPEKIVVAGHSAGAYLTSMIGLDKSWLKNYGVDADRIAALFPVSGNAVCHYGYRKVNGLGENQPFVDRFAPLYHVRNDCPPYIIITGDREREMSGRYEENAYMWRMMQVAGHKQCRIYELDGYNHGTMVGPAFHIMLGELLDLGLWTTSNPGHYH